MPFTDIVDSLFATSAILVVVFIIYAAFVLAHPHSVKAKAAIESPLKGCLAEASVWFSLTVVAIILASKSALLENIFEKVVGANILNVTIVGLSFVVVPITFAIHDAHKGFDYRPYAIAGFVLIALLCGLYYFYFPIS